MEAEEKILKAIKIMKVIDLEWFPEFMAQHGIKKNITRDFVKTLKKSGFLQNLKKKSSYKWQVKNGWQSPELMEEGLKDPQTGIFYPYKEEKQNTPIILKNNKQKLIKGKQI